MPMPVKFTAEQLVDAAVRLIVAGGPEAATATAVARAVGAPSGSVYHRFPARRDLLAAAWLGPVRRFQDGFLPVLDGGDDPVPAGVEAARHVVRWSAQNLPAATVLARYGRPDLVAHDCAPNVIAEADELDARLHDALARYLARFAAADRDRILVAIVDGPLALVRRSLGSGGPHAGTIELAAEIATALLEPKPPTAAGSTMG